MYTDSGMGLLLCLHSNPNRLHHLEFWYPSNPDNAFWPFFLRLNLSDIIDFLQPYTWVHHRFKDGDLNSGKDDLQVH